MSVARRVAQALPAPVVNVAAHRELYLPGLPGRDRRPIALVYGNCQAEALRRLLATHPGFAARYQLLRVPAVHEITPRALRRIHKRLPEVEVLISQEVRTDYRGMALGTAQIADRLPPTARVLRYPVAYFDGPFPFHVYVKRDHEPLATGAPISDYHDLRHLYAASRGWDTPTTLRRLDELELDPSWVRDNAERSLIELATREAGLTAQLTPLVRQHPTSSFMTINHPVNRLLTDSPGSSWSPSGTTTPTSSWRPGRPIWTTCKRRWSPRSSGHSAARPLQTHTMTGSLRRGPSAGTRSCPRICTSTLSSPNSSLTGCAHTPGGCAPWMRCGAEGASVAPPLGPRGVRAARNAGATHMSGRTPCIVNSHENPVREACCGA